MSAYLELNPPDVKIVTLTHLNTSLQTPS